MSSHGLAKGNEPCCKKIANAVSVVPLDVGLTHGKTGLNHRCGSHLNGLEKENDIKQNDRS